MPFEKSKDRPETDPARLNSHRPPSGRSLLEQPLAEHRPQLAAALYIESMVAELRVMARDVELDTLAYFLEMARLEASTQVERGAARLDRVEAK